MRKAQISFEYMFILALAFVIILGSVTLLTIYTRTTGPRVLSNQAQRFGQDIVQAAVKVHSIGKDSWITLQLNIPDEIEDVFIVDNDELVVQYYTVEGSSEVVLFSDVNITAPFGSGRIRRFSDPFHSGVLRLRIKSFGDYVNITEI